MLLREAAGHSLEALGAESCLLPVVKANLELCGGQGKRAACLSLIVVLSVGLASAIHTGSGATAFSLKRISRANHCFDNSGFTELLSLKWHV